MTSLNQQGYYKLNNGKKVNYTYDKLSHIDFQILIQRLQDLSVLTYDSDEVETSEEIGQIVDTLIDIEL